AVVAAAVGSSLDAKLCAESGACVMACEYLSILDRLNQSHAEQLKRNPKSKVVIGELPLEIGLLNIAPGGGRVISSPDNGVQLMHAAVARTVRFEDKPDFSDRAELRDKRRHSVGRALAVRNQVETRILRPTRIRVARIGYHKPARSTDRRLVVADATLIAIEPRAESGRVRFGSQERILPRIIAGSYVRASIASPFQLINSPHALTKQSVFVD